MNVEQQPTLFI